MLSLLQADFDLVISDLQGHGDSDHGGRFHGWNRSAELAPRGMAGSVRALWPGAKFAVGHSFGGVLTALMLEQDPSQFRRAVLLDPVLFSPLMIGAMALSDVVGLHKRNTLARKTRERRRHWPDRSAAYANLLGRGMFKGWTPEALQAYVDFGAEGQFRRWGRAQVQPSREADIFASFPRRLWRSLGKVQTPVKVDYGDKTFPSSPVPSSAGWRPTRWSGRSRLPAGIASCSRIRLPPRSESRRFCWGEVLCWRPRTACAVYSSAGARPRSSSY
jgi:pimeloyl-ACP methyl ester carboxylesterase